MDTMVISPYLASDTLDTLGRIKRAMRRSPIPLVLLMFRFDELRDSP
jgi:hypothetical protein